MRRLLALAVAAGPSLHRRATWRGIRDGKPVAVRIPVDVDVADKQSHEQPHADCLTDHITDRLAYHVTDRVAHADADHAVAYPEQDPAAQEETPQEAQAP